MKDKKNNLIDNISSSIKNHLMQIFFISIFSITLKIFLPIAYPIIDEFMRDHPIFGGVICSWLFAAISTLIVLILGFIYQEKKDLNDKILEKNKKLLAIISIGVLFYISINLASEALTGTGVPIVSEPYKIGPFINTSPQDVFLISFACIIIFLIFIAPYYIYSKLNIKHDFVISIFVSIIIISIILFFLFNNYAENISELSQKVEYEPIWPFGITIAIGILIVILCYFIPRKQSIQVEKFEDDLRDLIFYFSIIPAFIVASLALIGHQLVRYPNFPGNMVVGFLFISGFATLMILTKISLKDLDASIFICGSIVGWSLSAISFFCIIFLYLKPSIYDIETFRKILLFSIAIILIILQYGFSYEKILKYRFTEWWRRKWRPIAMVFSIILIIIVSAINPVPTKLLWIFFTLFLVFFSPWIYGLVIFRKYIEFRGFKTKIPLPECQAMVLIKVKTDKDSLIKVVERVDDMANEGVYKTMVVRGEYDLCLLIEGVDNDDITEKILKIRIKENDDGSVVSTTTLTDMSEFLEREFNQYEA
jgi:DNA-binding Lrp family transcriptional regulator